MTTPTVEDIDQRAFLDLFANTRRSWVCNTFLHTIRNGAATPKDVLAAVERELSADHARVRQYGDSDRLRKIEELYEKLNAHYDEALSYARWCLAWERLTPAEKAKQRLQKGEQYRTAYMRQQLPTSKQLDYIRALGYHGAVESRAHASELIEQLRRQPHRGLER